MLIMTRIEIFTRRKKFCALHEVDSTTYWHWQWYLMFDAADILDSTFSLWFHLIGIMRICVRLVVFWWICFSTSFTFDDSCFSSLSCIKYYIKTCQKSFCLKHMETYCTLTRSWKYVAVSDWKRSPYY